jgi:hypothetical protein
VWRLMSAFGTKRTCPSCRSMSAFGGKADIPETAAGEQIFVHDTLCFRRDRVRFAPALPAIGEAIDHARSMVLVA